MGQNNTCFENIYPKLSNNSNFILKERYLLKDDQGQTKESPVDLFKRVAKFIASVEVTDKKIQYWEKEFLNMLLNWEFHPGTRVLANAGKKNPQLANCFVFDIEDDFNDIFKKHYESSLTKKHGGGCGYNFSKIRPKGDLVDDEAGLSAGPVDIIKMFDLPTSIFRQQGQYESGNMAILNVNHPDIFEFIAAKDTDGVLNKTNISIGITNGFMNAVKNDQPWDLINPRTKQITNTVQAKVIWEKAVEYAHRTGDPGVIFLDNINNNNFFKETLGDIGATNPCGEVPLYPYESCNLGYLNLNAFVSHTGEAASIDFEKLKAVSKKATRFMDNVIDASWFPISEQKKTITSLRRIGIGVVGWADILVDLKIPYNSAAACNLARQTSKVIHEACCEASISLGKEKGVHEYLKQGDGPHKRNIALNTLPPSSGNAVIFNASFSIEPFFALAFQQNILDGVKMKNLNEKLKTALETNHITIPDLEEKILENHGSIQSIDAIPEHIKRLFLTAHDLSWKDHLRVQAAWQENIDNAITKTINLPSDTSKKRISKIYFKAWEMGCKGVTVYRDQSKKNQVIEFEKNKSNIEDNECPKCHSGTLVYAEGCCSCIQCSYSLCQI